MLERAFPRRPRHATLEGQTAGPEEGSVRLNTNGRGEWPPEDLAVCALCGQVTVACDRDGMCPNSSPDTDPADDVVLDEQMRLETPSRTTPPTTDEAASVRPQALRVLSAAFPRVRESTSVTLVNDNPDQNGPPAALQSGKGGTSCPKFRTADSSARK